MRVLHRLVEVASGVIHGSEETLKQDEIDLMLGG
jgi:hypothetical protein